MKEFSKSLVIGMMVLFASYAQVALAEEPEIEVDHALTLDFQTPHTDWAQPYAQGKTRILFFTTAEGIKPREGAELLQRFDLQAEAVFWNWFVDTTQTQWQGGSLGEARMLKLLEKKWDCFIFFEIPIDKMSEEQQYKLLKQVAEGAGIVFVGTHDQRILKDKNKLKELPQFLDVENIDSAYTVGKGRGVCMTQRPYFNYYEGWETDYDHWQERFGRAFLWAASKEPKSHLDISLSKTKGNSLSTQLRGIVTGKNPHLDLRIKDSQEERASFHSKSITPDQTLEYKLPYLPEGDYFIDARVISDLGVETWGTTDFRVQSSRSVTKVELAKTWGEIGDTIQGKAMLTGTRLKNEKLRVRLLDKNRRELTRKDRMISGDEGSFQFPIESWLPMLVTVEAVLYADGKEMSHAYSYFRVTKRNRGKFNFLLWGYPSGTLAPYAEESLAKHGATVQLGSGNPPLITAANNLAWVPYTTRIIPHTGPDTVLQSYFMPFCWNDDTTIEKVTSNLAKAYTPTRQHGAFTWSLGDETTTQGCCTSPFCLAAYQKYLKDIYGTLETLNASWSTHFQDWKEITLTKPDDKVTASDYQTYLKGVYSFRTLAYLWFSDNYQKWEAVPFNKDFYENEEADSWLKKNYPRWFDRMAFKSYNFAQLCKKYAKAYEAVDPQARTGVEGAGEFERGDDIDLIIRNTGWWGPYVDMGDEVIRSLAPRDYPRGNWMGYQKDADSLLQIYWRMVTRGMDTIMWWTWSLIGPYHGWLAPDFRPFPAVKEILKDTQVLRDGLGDLLIRSEMQDDGIAMLYSHPSVYAHKLEKGAGFSGCEESHKATHTLLREMGLQFRYVSDRMLRLGEFDKKKYKVLLLPRADALGDKEAAVIEDFVRSGGTLIVDVRPGIFNDRCKPRSAGVLDLLFGIKRKGFGQTKLTKAVIKEPAFTIDQARVDADVELGSGIAKGMADKIPVCIVNQVGKGRAVLLNLPFSSYPNPKNEQTPEGAMDFIRDLLSAAGVQPRVILKDEKGKRLRDIEVIRWRNRDLEILALFRAGGANGETEISLPKEFYVYDLRNRKVLGKTARIKTTVLKNRASFFVLSQQGVPSPDLRLSTSTINRGNLVKATISVPTAKGLHALRIRVGKEGQEMEWQQQNILTDGKPATFDLPIAFNDPLGAYEIKAIDLYTNQATQRVLIVK